MAIDLGFDESSRDSHRLLVVSAIIGQTSRMRGLSRMWKADLRRDSVDFFHAREHWNLQVEPYHGLSTARREELLKRLAACANKHIYAGISLTIDVREYKAMTSERFRSNFGSPYTMAIQLLTILIHNELLRRKIGSSQ